MKGLLFLLNFILLLLACTSPEKITEELPSVTAFYPSSDTLPENLLRVYVQFSKPMKTVGNLEKIKLEDAKGKEIEGAIFNNVYELWDASQQQLTLIFDPGRVKTGLNAHERMGRALKVGQTYRLRIEGLEDVNHQPLSESYTKTFFISSADTIAPNLDKWTLISPPLKTREPLKLQFPDMLDQYSLQGRLVITDVNNKPIQGKINVGPSEKSWQFIPTQNWQAGEYFLYANARLEDPAGNNLNGLFDHKIGSLKSNREGETLRLEFKVE